MNSSEEFIAQIEQHRGLISKVVFLYADSPDDRNDLTQEIIGQAWKSYASFRGDSKFATWLYRVAMNVSLSFLKQNIRRKDLDLPTNTGSYSISNEADLLDRILKALNPIEKSIVLLQIEGYRQPEIAEMVGISEINIRTKVHRIRKKLKTHGIDKLT